MPYKVIKDGATIPKDTGNRKALRTGVEFKVYTTTVYNAGQLLSDDEVSDVVKEKYDNGDEKVRGLIEKISKKEYDKGVVEESSGLLSRWQAEGAAEVDQPYQVQQAITRLDADYHDSDKAQLVATATDE